MIPLDFSGRTALVTGAAGGIGRGIVAALREAGAVVVAADRESGALESLYAHTDKVHTAAFDITDEEAVQAAAAGHSGAGRARNAARKQCRRSHARGSALYTARGVRLVAAVGGQRGGHLYLLQGVRAADDRGGKGQALSILPRSRGVPAFRPAPPTRRQRRLSSTLRR